MTDDNITGFPLANTDGGLRRRLAEENGPSVFPEAFDRHGNLKADWPKGAVAVVSNLDMLTDEPLELAVALRRLAESKADKDDWAKFAEKMSELVNDLKAMNEPPPRAA